MKRPAGDHELESSERLTKIRGIKCGGGYGPPPRYTLEQRGEFSRVQNMEVAAAGLKFLNETMATYKPEYELVAANTSAAFRSKIGFVYHGNFVAKRCDKTNAMKKLFFVECNLARDSDGVLGHEVIKCIDLGPVNMAAAQCRRSCKLCRFYDLISPIFHPPGFKILHLLLERIRC